MMKQYLMHMELNLTITYTRFPFNEYHTHLDTPDKIDEMMLRQTEKS